MLDLPYFSLFYYKFIDLNIFYRADKVKTIIYRDHLGLTHKIQTISMQRLYLCNRIPQTLQFFQNLGACCFLG